MTLAAVNVDVLRQGWEDAISALAPDLPEVSATLVARLDQAQREGRLDEQSLLAIVEDVRAATARAGGADVARLLSRRLQRAVYEYLLSLDALTPEETMPAPVEIVSHEGRGDLIGVEEVAELAGRQATKRGAEAEPVAEAPPTVEARAEPDSTAEPGDEAAVEPGTGPEAVASEHEIDVQAPSEQLEADDEAEAPVALDTAEQAETAAQPADEVLVDAGDDTGTELLSAHLEAVESVEEEPVDVEPATAGGASEPEAVAPGAEAAEEIEPLTAERSETETSPTEPSEVDGRRSKDGARRTRFMIFRQQSRKDEAPKSPDPSPAVADAPKPPEASSAANEAPKPPDPSPAADDIATTTQYPVAPVDGFHLTDYPDLLPPTRPDDQGRVTILEEFELPPAPPAVEPPPLEKPLVRRDPPTASVEPTRDADKGWHVRKSGRHQTGEGRKGSPEQLADEDDSESRARFENDPTVVEARHQIGDRLRRRRCDEAASLLQKLAADVGGRPVSELALDAGDRCRALGKANAALSCYLAASRADPVHEPPLLRLADICLDDQDIELAVSYLERVARLRRLRDDQKGALRIYRKITTVAPYRDDVLAVLMRAQATGRFEE